MRTSNTYASHLRAVLKLGLPLIASNLAQFAIHMTDGIMLGRYDVTAYAASTLAGTCFFIVFIVGSGLGIAVTPLVAEAAEAGDERSARRATRMGLWLSAVYGALFMVPFIWAEEILLWSGQTAEVAAFGSEYLYIAIWGLIPALLVMTMKSFLAALEHAAVILWVTIAAAFLNAALNYVFIFGNFGAPELGIQGAAIASVAVHVLSIALLFAYAVRRLPQFDLLRNLWVPDTEAMGRVFRLGWPIGVTALLEAGLFSASSIMMGWIGTIELASHGIALQWASLFFVAHVALSQAATVRAGQALARKDTAGLYMGAKVVIGVSLTLVVGTMLLFFFLPHLLVEVFISPDEVAREEVLAIGIVLLSFAAVFQLMDAMQVMALGLLRGVQDTKVPMILAAISYWVIGLPVGYLLAFRLDYGPEGLWLGLVIGLLVAAILLLRRFVRFRLV